MSQFDRETNEVISLVNENHRRSNITQTVGMIVPLEEAERIAIQKCRANRDAGNAEGTGLMLTALFVIAMVSISILAGLKV